jgi:hypothetical protein
MKWRYFGLLFSNKPMIPDQEGGGGFEMETCKGGFNVVKENWCRYVTVKGKPLERAIEFNLSNM